MTDLALPRRLARLTGVALLGGVLALGAGAAHAAKPNKDRPAGDERATSHAGNVKTCAQVGLAESEDITSRLKTDKDGTHLDVLGVPDGYEVTGIVVKGGPAHNLYRPGRLGEPPWKDLHAPLTPSGKPAAISHWFACVKPATGGGGTSPSPSDSPTPTPSDSPTPTPSDSASPSPSDSTSPSPTGSASTAPDASQAPGAVGAPPSPTPTNAAAEKKSGGLPFTGANLAVATSAAIALLFAGTALVVLTKRPHLLRRSFQRW